MKRNASFYNSDIAGLTEEEAEVPLYLFFQELQFTMIPIKFRGAVVEFAEKEVAPRAAEIDKTNTFPSVSFAFLFHSK